MEIDASSEAYLYRAAVDLSLNILRERRPRAFSNDDVSHLLAFVPVMPRTPRGVERSVLMAPM